MPSWSVELHCKWGAASQFLLSLNIGYCQLLVCNEGKATLRFSVFLFCLKQCLCFVCGAFVNMVSHQTKVLFLVVFQHERNIGASEMEKLSPIFSDSLQIILYVECHAVCHINIAFFFQMISRVFVLLGPGPINSCNIFWSICQMSDSYYYYW